MNDALLWQTWSNDTNRKTCWIYYFFGGEGGLESCILMIPNVPLYFLKKTTTNGIISSIQKGKYKNALSDWQTTIFFPPIMNTSLHWTIKTNMHASTEWRQLFAEKRGKWKNGNFSLDSIMPFFCSIFLKARQTKVRDRIYYYYIFSTKLKNYAWP